MQTAGNAGDKKAARSGHLSGLESYTKLDQSDDTTRPPSTLVSRNKVMESEAQTLERGAEVLAHSIFSNAGPAMETLGRALEVLLRAEAERKRHKVRSGRSVASIFRDGAPA